MSKGGHVTPLFQTDDKWPVFPYLFSVADPLTYRMLFRMPKVAFYDPKFLG